MRVVLDTNIFISSILGGRLKIIVDEWKAGKFKLIVSEAIAREYLDVINRPKFKIPQIEIVTATEYLLQNAEFVTPEEKIVVIVADSTDNKFLEAAVAGKVNYIVSGDGHLLDLGSFRDIPIITARDFIDLLNS
ncbi:MAG: putative toxin-antitoxin system toxin component, PIN family [Chloroflexota bacterium]